MAHCMLIDVLHMICTGLHPGHLSVHVGDSLQRNEEIVKISNCAFKCDYYYYYYYYYYNSMNTMQTYYWDDGGLTHVVFPVPAVPALSWWPPPDFRVHVILPVVWSVGHCTQHIHMHIMCMHTQHIHMHIICIHTLHTMLLYYNSFP